MKIKGDYLIVDTPEEAVCFLGEEVEVFYLNGWHIAVLGMIGLKQVEGEFYQITVDGGVEDAEFSVVEYPLRIPRETIKKVLEPKEREAYVGFQAKCPEKECPFYGNYLSHDFKTITRASLLKANALTIGKTVGELHELWRWLYED